MFELFAPGRALVVVGLIAAVFVLAVAYRRWQAGALTAPTASSAVLPAELHQGSERTWVIFTTPYCATCSTVEHQLRAGDPVARVVRVDATVEPTLARSLRVRTAPTVFLSDRRGHVVERLVGAEAVRRRFAGVRA